MSKFIMLFMILCAGLDAFSADIPLPVQGQALSVVVDYEDAAGKGINVYPSEHSFMFGPFDSIWDIGKDAASTKVHHVSKIIGPEQRGEYTVYEFLTIDKIVISFKFRDVFPIVILEVDGHKYWCVPKVFLGVHEFVKEMNEVVLAGIPMRR